MNESCRLHIVDQLHEAADHRAMARILLRAPDMIVVEHHEALSAACRERRFIQGAQFLDVRVAALCANRDRVGRLPDKERDALELWRSGFASLALRTVA